MAERIVTRLFVEPDLTTGVSVTLSADHAHFLRAVLRLSPSAKLALFNGRNGEWLAELESIGKKQASALVLEQRREQQPSHPLHLVFAPVKKGPMDFLIQKSVELGVADLHPVATARTQGDRLKEDRIRAQCIEAAEQCERLDVPAVHPLRKLEAFLDDWPENIPLFVCAEAGEAEPLPKVLQVQERENLLVSGNGLMTGPEGGFSAEELVFLRKRPFVTLVGLGPRILRAETAAVAGLTIWQAIIGDMAERPPLR